MTFIASSLRVGRGVEDEIVVAAWWGCVWRHDGCEKLFSASIYDENIERSRILRFRL